MRRLLLLLLLAALLPVLLVRAGMYFRWVYSQYQKEMQANLEMACIAATAFNAYLNDVARQASAIGAALLSLEPPETQRATDFLVRSASQYSSVRGFHWVDLEGTIVNSSNSKYLGLCVKDRWHFQQALARDSWVVSDLLQSRLDGVPLIIVARAIRDESGQARGVIVAAIDPDLLEDEILTKGGTPDSMLAIIDRQGRIVAAEPEMHLEWDKRIVTDDGLLAKALAGEPAVGITRANVLEGRWAVARVPISGTGFVASAGRSVDSMMTPLWVDVVATGLALGLAIAGAVVVAIWISRRINRGMQGLEKHAAAVAQGNLDHRAEVTNITELQNLAEAFNRSAEQRKQAELALRESEERFRLATEAIAGFLYDWEVRRGTVQHSQGLRDLLGFEPEPGRTVEWCFNRVHPDDRPAVERVKTAILSGREDLFSCEYRLRHADGHYVWIHDRGRIVRDASGEAVRVVGGVTDISKRKAAEQALGEREALLHALIESLPFDVWAVDTDDRYILLNSLMRQRWGNVSGLRPDDIDVPPEVRELWRSNNLRAIGGEEIRGEVNYTVEGQELTFVNVLAPIRDGDEIRGAVGVNIDITDRKCAEERLRESEEKFRGLAEHARAMIAIVQERRLIYTNPYMSKVSGYSREELAAIDIADMIHPDHRQMVLEWPRLRQLGQPVPDHYEFMMITKNGQECWIELSPAIIVYRGQPAVIGIGYDITERKRAEQQLKELNETLEQRVAERTAVAEQRAAQLRAMAAELSQTEERERRRLAQMLHDDLQQLLAATKFHAGVLQGRLANDVLREHLQHVVDLLDQSIKASRSLTIELSPPILYDAGLVAALSWLARWMQNKHGLHVTIKAESEADPMDEQVRVFLFQAVRELLFNVVKHSGTDRARVEMACRGDEVEIQVSDEGAGFDPNHPRAVDRTGGFGLFSIRERIELLDGRIEVQSSPGAGTRVTLWTPARPRPKGSGPSGGEAPAVADPPAQDPAPGTHSNGR